MKKNSASPPAPPESTPDTGVPERQAPPKKSVSAVKKIGAKVPAPRKSSARQSATQAQAPADKPADSKALTDSSPAPVPAKRVRSKPNKAAVKTPAKTRKKRLESSALPMPENLTPIMAIQTAEPPAVTPPVVNDAELWEQGSPIRIRIAQLRTRNAFLEEQFQRLRPPVQVRGKKK